MKLSQKQRFIIDCAVERLYAKTRELRVGRALPPGSAAAPRPQGYIEDDPLIGQYDTTWMQEIEPENGELDKILLDILATDKAVNTTALPKLDDTNLWVWGGPTPYWGGSMSDDTLIKGADYFNASNVVYVYGATNEKMLSLHAKYSKMLCQINDNCRTPGAQEGQSNEENAEMLSKLSLKFPNIAGAICDDVETNFVKIVLPERFETRYKALKKYNTALKMYGVFYVQNLYKDFSLIQNYMDVINLWFWRKNDILEFDEYIELCQNKFPGKPILLGIFLHEYGWSDIGNVPELLKYQLDKAREYIGKGVMEGVVLLGDREIKKWPDVANFVKEYLKNQ